MICLIILCLQLFAEKINLILTIICLHWCSRRCNCNDGHERHLWISSEACFVNCVRQMCLELQSKPNRTIFSTFWYGRSQRPHLNSISKLLFHSLSHDHSQSSSYEKQIELQPESDANLTRPALASPTYQHVHAWKNQVASPILPSKLKNFRLLCYHWRHSSHVAQQHRRWHQNRPSSQRKVTNWWSSTDGAWSGHAPSRHPNDPLR